MVLVREQRLDDFTGGLNLRADAYHLSRTESPDLLNVDIDPRAGVRSRGAWESTTTSAVGSAVKRLHSWLRLSGVVTTVVACADGTVKQRNGAGWANVNGPGSVTMAVAASPHKAEFVEWDDDLYILGGGSVQAHKWSGAGNTAALTASATGAWQEDYTAGVGGHMPKAEYATTYSGYMVVANTTENGVSYPNRIRFSHPNGPEDWKEQDFFDITEGGAEITGIVAFDDHVLIFKQQSMHAIYGYSRDSFAPVNLTADAGCPHRNAFAVGVQSCYFFSYPDGIMEYIPNTGVKEWSLALRPIIDSGDLNVSSLENVNVGWLNKRLWFGAPYELGEAAPTSAKTVFVLDPQLGAWTRFVGADGSGLGPFATGGGKSADGIMLAYAPASDFVMAVDQGATSTDIYGSTSTDMDSYYRTRWFAAGSDATKKLWRRPEYVVSEMPAPYTLTVEVYRDLNEANRRSEHTVLVETGSGGALWNAFNWNDGTIYGAPPEGARYEKGGSIGMAKSICLKFVATSGEAWGLNAVINKFKERKLR